MSERDRSTAEVSALRLRVRIAVAIEAFARGALVAALAFGAALLAARVAGLPLDALVRRTVLWPLVPVCTGVVVAILRLGRGTLDDGAARALLDRRLGLRGLLLVADLPGAGAWRRDLDQRLRDAPQRARPRLQLGDPSLRLLGAAAFLTAIALLPPPAMDPSQASVGRALTVAVADTAVDVELALEQGAISEARGEELRRRAEALRERLRDGDPVAWSDVDALRDALRFEEESQRSGLDSIRSSLESAVERAQGGDDPSTAEQARQQAARLVDRAGELGLFEDLPPDLREAIERAAAGASGSRESAQGQRRDSAEQGDANGQPGAGLDLDPEQLKRLARALSEAAGDRLARLPEDRPPLSPGELPDLGELLAKEGLLGGAGAPIPGAAELPGAAGGDGFDPTPGPDGDGEPGRGGVNRGRADADLGLSGGSEIDTAALRPEKLAPGAAVPDRWQVVGAARANPQGDPERSAATLGAGAAQDGTGQATFRRSLAPRHRDAVRRFFSDPPAGGR
ncbi:MAG: hypothetical protein IPM29_23225 [Planctomycetes bacterium]|nr:hypothetical protein [Planctomycetota bacterium]